jgi:hypothetical protein
MDKNDAIRGIDATNPNGNRGKRSPATTGKPLSLGDRGRHLGRILAHESHLGNFGEEIELKEVRNRQG